MKEGYLAIYIGGEERDLCISLIPKEVYNKIGKVLEECDYMVDKKERELIGNILEEMGTSHKMDVYREGDSDKWRFGNTKIRRVVYLGCLF